MLDECFICSLFCLMQSVWVCVALSMLSVWNGLAVACSQLTAVIIGCPEQERSLCGEVVFNEVSREDAHN